MTAGSHLQVSMSGSTSKVLFNGTEILETIDGFNADVTVHGMRASTDDLLDDFQITSAP